MAQMSSSRPYLLQALFDWIVANDCTPYVLVDATISSVEVPQQYVKDGQIVLNISPSAVTGFSISGDGLFFNARFGGIATDIHAPSAAIMGIYARENGQGMIFEPEDKSDPDPEPPKEPPKTGKPSLKVVK